MGRKYLNHKDCEFIGKPDGDMYVVEEKVDEKTIELPLKSK